MNSQSIFPIASGLWRQQVTFEFPIRQLIFVVKDGAGIRVENGLSQDLTIDVNGTSYAVRSISELRRDTQETYDYSASPNDLEKPGGQDTGVLVIRIDISPGSEIHLHATWPEALGPRGTLEILAS